MVSKKSEIALFEVTGYYEDENRFFGRNPITLVNHFLYANI